jgi:hypothetical protein
VQKPAPAPPSGSPAASVEKTIPSGPAGSQISAAVAAAKAERPSSMPPPQRAPTENQLVTIPPPRSGLRTTLTLVIGAVVLMSVGFGTVALVMHLMGKG